MTQHAAEVFQGPLERRAFAKIPAEVTAIGLGCWQIGGSWGDVDPQDAENVLGSAADAGITFFDTADVYGDGRSETLVGTYRQQALEQGLEVFVATKIGRRANPFEAGQYTEENLRAWVERSRMNLQMETLDLVQLHCPPPEVYGDDAVFAVLDELVEEGKVRAYGVSVETCEEALRAIERPGVASVQIILNAFRLKPLDRVLPAAREAGVGIIARVPLASGLLTGKITRETEFAADDHRAFNRDGSAFDVGETFSGVDFETGLEAVSTLQAAVPEGWTLPEAALAWILAQEGVTAVIPGARNAAQVARNAAVGRKGPLPSGFGEAVERVYNTTLRQQIHDRW
ncbi:aldo/keto reductase [Micrococcales bacterium 31B]|nr:aldo/keto reductase [Micrococcales bacterium 31B]